MVSDTVLYFEVMTFWSYLFDLNINFFKVTPIGCSFFFKRPVANNGRLNLGFAQYYNLQFFSLQVYHEEAMNSVYGSLVDSFTGVREGYFPLYLPFYDWNDIEDSQWNLDPIKKYVTTVPSPVYWYGKRAYWYVYWFL